MFIFERETEHKPWEGRIWSRLQALSCQYRAQRGAWTHELQEHDLSSSQALNWLSHPGAPCPLPKKIFWGAWLAQLVEHETLWSQDCEFSEPQFGCRDYLKIKSLKKFFNSDYPSVFFGSNVICNPYSICQFESVEQYQNEQVLHSFYKWKRNLICFS